ncbi:MAG: mechanosensitive ion channel family protein [Sandaracinaceae bacterium]|nr:mechanosensitive ion channel family protein [Sandaracinaceae bacterium]
MPGADDVYTLFSGSVTPFMAFGFAFGLALLLLVRLIVPPTCKSVVRAPLLMLLGSLALAVVEGLLPPSDMDQALRLTQQALLLFSIARSLYLALLYGIFESRRRTRSRVFSGIFRDVVQVGMYVVAVFVLLGEAGVEPGSLLTSSVLLTAVIGLSLQDTLGNLFAGIAIQVQQPFEVGDWIQFDEDPSKAGEVVEINWRATRLMTIDRVEVTVPNNTLARAAIRNFSRPTHAVRRQVRVVAPMATPPARVHRLLAEAVTEVDGVLDEPSPDIQTLDFNERGVEYRVRYFLQAYDQREVIDSRVRDRIWYALRRAALAIPPPQRTVTMIEHNAASAQLEHAAQIVDIEKALARVTLFAPLPDVLLHEVAMHTERRLYAPGEVVIQQGDVGHELFIVERGALDVLVDVHDGMEHIASVGVGDVFGEMSLMTGAERSATVRTTAESTLLVVSKETLQPVLEASPELAEKFSQILAAREAALGDHSRGSMAPSRERVEQRSSELLTRIREFFSI